MAKRPDGNVHKLLVHFAQTEYTRAMAASKKTTTRRGAPDVIAKRSAARALNQLFDERRTAAALDGRTLKRKKRLLDELKNGKKGQPLKAVEALAHAHELLGLGETLSSLRKLKPKVPSAPSMGPEENQVVRAAQEAYAFDKRAWRLLGVDVEKVVAGGPARPKAKKKAPAKRTRRSKSTR